MARPGPLDSRRLLLPQRSHRRQRGCSRPALYLSRIETDRLGGARLRQHYPGATAVNLLLDEDFMPLLADPGLLRRKVEALPAESWVVIDEIQRLPVLLNEVHELIARHGKRYRYALTGSSARKLRRLDADLLAGRVIEREMYPLVAAELGRDFSLTRALTFGTLPDVYAEPERQRTSSRGFPESCFPSGDPGRAIPNIAGALLECREARPGLLRHQRRGGVRTGHKTGLRSGLKSASSRAN